MSVFDSKMQSGFSKLRTVAGDVRQFVIADGFGGITIFNALVVWSRDIMKTSPIATATGVYFADIFCTFFETDLPRLPTEGEFLESPQFTKYEIVGVERGSGIVTLSLLRRAPRE